MAYLDGNMKPALSARPTRYSLLGSCAVAAMAFVPQVAQAQGFAGTFETPTIVAVNGSTTTPLNASIDINTSIPNLDTISVNTSNNFSSTVRAVINWTPTDQLSGPAPIVFLPTGATANFVAGANVSDFTILNRIIPTNAASSRAVRFDGTITSRIAETPGGSVFFYSPNGIIAGAGSIFDVGNLVLSASDISLTDSLRFAPNSRLSFGQASNSTAAITIEEGARIEANRSGSYVALVAPQINQGGEVFVNGSAIYVAAEAADLYIQDQLFGIAIRTGTTVSNAITHTGSTTSDAPVDFSDKRRIYMASLAKNDAITLLVGGTLGYEAAKFGEAVDGAIILSAGGGINETGDPTAESVIGAAPVNLQIGGGSGGAINFRNFADLRADGNVIVSPNLASSLNFGSGVAINAGREALVSAGSDQSILIAGNLSVESTNSAEGARAAVSATFDPMGGSTRGNIAIGGGLLINGGDTQFIEGEARRSVAALDIIGGTLSVGDDVDLRTGARFFGSTSTGGNSSVLLTGGGSLSASAVFIDAGARSEVAGEIAQSGTASLTVSGSTLTTNFVSLNASADGFNGASAAGGTINLNLAGSDLALGSIGLDASARVAFGRGGGPIQVDAIAPQIGDIPSSAGGSIFVQLTNPGLSLSGNISLRADATMFGGGEGGFPAFVAGNSPALGGASNFTGGTISLITTGGTLNASSISLSASATGSGIDANAADSAAEGGSVELISDGTALSVGLIELTADANGSNGEEIGGSAQAGSVRLETRNGGSIVTDSGAFNRLSASAFAGAGRIGGDAIGGTINIATGNGRLALGSTLLASVDGFAGSTRQDSFGGIAGTRGGTGSAGTLNLTIGVAGSSDLTQHFEVNSLNLNAVSAESGTGNFFTASSDGTDASGGQINITQLSGTSRITNLIASADSDGGDGGFSNGIENAGIGGDSTSGNVVIDISGGRAEWRTITASSIANGGNGGNGNSGGEGFTPFDAGPGGNAVAGRVALTIGSGTLVTDLIRLEYEASGGDSGSNALGVDFGEGGSASGGVAELTMQGLATLEIGYGGSQAVLVQLLGNNAGGNGSVGGSAVGGSSTLNILGSGTGSDPVFAAIAADAVGGSGASHGDTGGNAIGGTATLRIAGGSQIVSSAVIGAEGFGGSGGGESGYGEIGGAGGTATGGTAQLLTSVDTSIDSLTLRSTALGGSGGFAKFGGNGGDALTGGRANIEVTGGQLTIGSLSIDAESRGGSGSSGAEGFAGRGGSATAASVRLATTGSGSQLTVDAGIISASAFGGDSGTASRIDGTTDVNGNRGGSAVGGTVDVFADALTTLEFLSSAEIRARAFGGAGGQGAAESAGGDGGAGGSATGGTILADGRGGILRAAISNFSVNVQGGSGGDGGGSSDSGIGGGGGTATGGSVSLLGVTDFGSVDNTIVAEANATGGSGGGGTIGGNGGDALATLDPAGSITFGLGLNSVPFVLQALQLSANGTGGAGGQSTAEDAKGGTGGIGSGGRVLFRNDGPDATLGSVELLAQGIGGAAGGGANGGDGGAANGGSATLNVIEGIVAITGFANVSANAFGATGAEGAARDGGVGGSGLAGMAQITVGGLGNLSIGELGLSANGFGGDGGFGKDNNSGIGGDGGTGTGGTARINNSGTFSAQTGPDATLLRISAQGTGGFAGSLDNLESGGSFGSGGAGRGGTAVVMGQGGATFSFTDFAIDARGFGGGYSSGPITSPGIGGNGDGIGGLATLDTGGTFTAENVALLAAGLGGQGIISDSMVVPGNGGDGRGGEVSAQLTGDNAIASLRFDASGIGGRGGSSREGFGNGGAGGLGQGGSAAILFASGTPTATIIADVRGIGGVGGSGIAGGDGGDALGGRITTTSSNIASTGLAQFLANAVGGAGGDGDAQLGGAGGNAFGGVIDFGNAGGTITLSDIIFDVSATGGNAGNRSGISIPGIEGLGRDGGDATGGGILIDVISGGTVTLGSGLTFRANATGGRGGNGIANSNGGLGGDGFGGRLTFAANEGSFVGGDFSLSISGTGGQGGNGGIGDNGLAGVAGATGPDGILGTSPNGGIGIAGTDGQNGSRGGSGGMGGNAVGGTFELSTNEGLMSFDSLTIDLSGFGGLGGNGALGGNGGTGGTGGDGGDGADDFTPPFTSGNGGDGGAGGRGGDGGFGGDAGGGGFGDGGTSRITASSGNITFGNVRLIADGVGSTSGLAGDGGNAGAGGAGGLRGEAGYGSGGTSGVGGAAGDNGDFGQRGDGENGFAFGNGGSLNFFSEETDGTSLGTIRANTVALTSNGRNSDLGIGGGGGNVSLIGQGIEGQIPFVFANLIVDAVGNSGGLVTIDTGASEATFSGLVSISTTGNVFLGARDLGGLRVGTSFDVNASGTVTARHIFDPATAMSIAPTVSADNITINGFLGIDALNQPLNGETSSASFFALGSGGIDLRSDFGSVLTSRLVSTDSIAVSAGFNVVIGQTIAQGTPDSSTGEIVGGNIDVRAGNNRAFLPPGTRSFGDVIVVGPLTASGNINLSAGNDVFLSVGTAVRSDNAITIASGDDIILSDSTLTSAINLAPDVGYGTFGDITIGAGALVNVDGRDPADVSSLIGQGGSLTAVGKSILLSGEAISYRFSSVEADNFSAQIVNAPVPGIDARDDDGLLTGTCLEGNLCIGTTTADTISLGGANAIFVDASAVLTGDSINVAARDLIDIGASAHLRAASSGLQLESQGLVQIGASARLTSQGGITVDAGDVTLLNNAIISGNLVSVFATLNTPALGTVRLGQDSEITGSDVNVFGEQNIDGATDINGDIGFGSINAGNSVGLGTNGGIKLGNLSSGNPFNTIDSSGSEIETGTLSISGFVSIGGTSVSNGDNAIRAGGISVGGASASDNIRYEGGGDVFLSFGQAGTIDLSAGGNVVAGSLFASSGGGVTINAGGAASFTEIEALSGSIIVGTQVDSITGGSALALNDVTLIANSSVDVGNLTGATVTATAGTSIETGNIVSTAGNIELSAATGLSTGNLTATGGSILLTNTAGLLSAGIITAEGDFSLDTGSLVTIASVVAGDDIDIVSTRGVTLTNGRTTGLGADSELDGSNIAVSASAITTGALSSAGDIALTSAGAISTTTLSAMAGGISLSGAGNVIINSGTTAIASRDALIVTTTGGDITTTSGNAAFTTLSASGGIAASSSGTLGLGAIGAGGSVVASANATGATALTYSTLNSGTTASLTSNGGIAGTGAALAGGNFTALGNGTLAFGAITSTTGAVDLRTLATQAVTTGNLTAATGVTIDGRGTALRVNTIATGDILVSNGNVLLDANNGLTTGDITANSITLAKAAVSGPFTMGLITADDDFTLNSAGNFTLDGISVGDDVTITAGATGTLGVVTARGDGIDNESDGSNVILSGTTVRTTSVSAIDDLRVSLTGTYTNTGLIDVGGGASVTATNGAFLGTVTADGDISATVTQMGAFNLSFDGGLTSGGAIALSTGGAINGGGAASAAGNITINSGVGATAGGSSVIGNLTSTSGSVAVFGPNSGNATTTGNISAANNITITGRAPATSINGITTGNLVATNGDITIASTSSLRTGNVTALNGSALLSVASSSGTAVIGNVTVENDFDFVVPFIANIGGISVGDDITLTGTGSTSLGALTTTGLGTDDEGDGSNVSITGIANASLQSANIVGSFTANVTNDFMSLPAVGTGRLIAGGDVSITAARFNTVRRVTSGGNLTVTNGAASVEESIVAGDLVIDGALNNAVALNVDVTGNLAITARSGSIAIRGFDVGGSIDAVANAGLVTDIQNGSVAGNLTFVANNATSVIGNVTVGGDVRSKATGSAQLNPGVNIVGGFVNTDGSVSRGDLIIEGSSVRINGANVAGSLGAKSDIANTTLIQSSTIGEDVLIIGGIDGATTGLSAGDDLTINADRASLGLNAFSTRGIGADNRTISHDGTNFVFSTSAANGSDLTATNTGSITAISTSASDDLTLTAGTTFSSSGILSTSAANGIDGEGNGRNIVINAVGAATLSGAINSAGNASITSTTGLIRSTTTVSSAGNIGLDAATSFTILGATTASGNIAITTDSAEIATAALSGRNVLLDSGGAITTGAINAINDVTIGAVADASFGAITSGDDIRLTGTGAITVASLTTTTSGTDGEADGRNIIVTGNLSRAGAIALTSAGRISISGSTTTTSGGAINFAAQTGITTGAITAATAVTLSNPVGTVQTGLITSASPFTLNTPSLLNLAGVSTTGASNIAITSTNAGTSSVGNLSVAGATSTISATAANLTVGTATAGGALSLTASNGNLVTGNVSGNGVTLTQTGTGSATLGNVTSPAGSITIATAGNLVSGNLSALLGSIALNIGGTSITTGLIGLRDDFTLITAANLDLAGITAGDDIRITTTGTATLGQLTTNSSGTDTEADGRNIVIVASGVTNITSANAFTDITVRNSDALTFGTLNAGRDVNLGIPSGIQAMISGGAVTAARDINANATLFAPTALLNSGRDINVVATSFTLGSGAMAANDINARVATLVWNGATSAGRDVNISNGAARTDVTISGPVGAGRDVNVTSGNALINGALSSVGDINIDTVSFAGSGNLTANDDVSLLATGTIASTGLISTNAAAGSDGDGDGRSIDISGASLALAGVTAVDGLSLTSSTGGISTGALTGANVIVNSATSLGSGAIVATGGNIGITTVGAITTGDLTANFGSVSIANTLGLITTGLIGVGNDFSLSTGSNLDFAGVSVGDDIRITTSGNAMLGRLTTRGTGADNETDGSNIVLTIGGDATVDHAESDNDFTATATNFATGLNSIITLGDIDITTTGDSDLGNSNAGGFVRVDAGGMIDFANIGAGSTTSLMAGTDITGGAITSGGAITADAIDELTLSGATNTGGNIDLVARRVVLTGPVSAAFDLFVRSGNGGVLQTGTVAAGRDIRISSAGGGTLDLANLTADHAISASSSGAVMLGSARTTGAFDETGYGTPALSSDITLSSGLTVNFASLDAFNSIDVRGDSVQGGSLRAGDNIFVVGANLTSLGQIDAGDSLGVRGVTVTGTGPWSAGEDILILDEDGSIAAQSSNLIGALTAGDDIEVRSTSGDIFLTSATTTGLGSDTRSLNFGLGFSIGTATAGGSDIILTTVPGGNAITAGTLIAADDIAITSAAGANITGSAQTLGFGATGGESNIIINAASFAGVSNANAASNLFVTAATDATVGTATAGQAISITAGNIVDFTALTSGGATTISLTNPTPPLPGRILGTSINAGTAITLSAGTTGTVNATNTTSGTATTLTARNVFGTTAIAGANFTANAANINLGTVQTTGAGSILLTAADLRFGALTSAVDVVLAQPTGPLGPVAMSGGTISAARDIRVNAFGPVTISRLTAGDDIIATGNGLFDFAVAEALGTFVEAGYGADGSNISVTSSAGFARIGTGRARDAITLNALSVTSGTSLTTDNGAITLTGGAGGVMVQSATATNNRVDASGFLVNIANVTARSGIDINAVMSTNLGTLSTATGVGDISITAPNVSLTSANASRDLLIDVNAGPGPVALNGGSLNAARDVNIDVEGAIVLTGLVSAGNNATLIGDSVQTAAASTGGRLSITSDMGAITTGALSGGTGVALNSATTLTSGNIAAITGDIGIATIGAITTGNLTANLGSVSLTNILGLITTGLINVGNDFSLSTGSDLDFAGVSVGDDIRITTSGNALLGRLTTRGTGVDNDMDGSNIVLTVGGDATVAHADSANDFTATATNFATGINSIITAGDIDITTTGDSDLGNSTAGGFVRVDADGRIDFTSVASRGSTTLIAGSNLTGGSILAGSDANVSALNQLTVTGVTATSGDISLSAGLIDAANLAAGNDLIVESLAGNMVLTGTATAGRDLVLRSNSGTISAANLTAGRGIDASASGNITLSNAQTTGQFDETGYGTPATNSNINLSSLANVTIGTANAFNTIFVNSASTNATSLIAGDDIFAVSTGITTIGTASAGGNIGVRGVSVLSSGTFTAGEDILIVDQEPVFTPLSATLATLIAGDDITVRSVNGAVTVGDLTTTGAGRDDRGLGFDSRFFITGSTPNGADISLSTVPGGTSITTGILSSANDIALTAQTSIATGNATAGGQIDIVATTGGITTGNLAAADVSINSATTLNAGNIVSNPGNIGITTVGAITTGDLTANLGSISLTNGAATITTGLISVGNDFSLTTMSNLDFAGVTVGDDIRITTSGNALLGRLTTTGAGTDNETDGSNIALSIGGNTFVDHADSAGNFVTTAGRFETGPATIVTDGDIVISTNGDAILSTSRAGGAINVSAGGVIDFDSLTAGLFTSLSGNTIAGGNSTSGDSFSAFGQNGVTLGTISSGPSLQVFNRNGNLQIASGTSTGNIAIGGEGLGNVAAGTLLADGDIFVSSGGNLSVGSANARGIFTFGGGEGGTGNGGAFTTDGNVFIIATGAATLDTATARSAIGVTGTSVAGTGIWAAGEDILVRTPGAVSLNALTAGDDLTIDAGGAITLTSGIAAGTARDDRALSLETGYGGSSFFAINGSPADGSDTRLTSGGNITAGTVRAADDDFVIATGNVSIDLLTAWGISTTDGRSDALVNAGGSVLIQTADVDDSLAVRGASVAGQNWIAGEDIGISSSGLVSYNMISAGDRLSITGRSISGSTSITRGTGPNDRRIDFAGSLPAFVAETGGRAALVDLTATNAVTYGMIASAGDVSINAGSLVGQGATPSIAALGRIDATTTGVANLGAAMAGAGIIATAGGNVTYATLQAGGAIAVTSGGDIIGGNATGNAGISFLAVDGGISAAALTSSAGNIALTARNLIDVASLNATTGGITVASTRGAIDFDTANAATDLTLTADGALTFATIAAGGTITATSATGNITGTSATAGNDLLLAAAGDIALQTASATDGVSANSFGAQTFGSVTAGGDILLVAGGLVAGTSLIAGDDIDIFASGANITLARTTGLGSDASFVTLLDVPRPGGSPDPEPNPDPDPNPNPDPDPTPDPVPDPQPVPFPNLVEPPSPSVFSGANIRVSTGGAQSVTTASSAGAVLLSNFAGNVASDTITAATLIDARSVDGAIALGDTTAAQSITLFSQAGNVSADTLTAGTAITLGAGGNIDVASSTSGAEFAAVSLGTIALANVVSGASILIEADDDVDATTLRAANSVSARTNQSLDLDSMIATSGGITFRAGQDIIGVSAIAGGAIVLTAGDAIGFGTLNGQSIAATATGAAAITTATARDDASIAAASITLGSASAGRDLSLTAQNALTQTGTATAGRDARISGGVTNLASLTAGDDISVTAAGALTIGSVRSTGLFTESGYGAMPDGSNVSITATGAATIQTLAEAHNNLTIGAASVSGATVRAGNDASITTPGSVTLDLIAGSGARDGASLVTVDAMSGITVPRFDVTGDVALTAANGAILVATDLRVSGTVDASGRVVSLTSLGALNGRSLGATAGDLSVVSGGNLAVATGQSRGDIRLTSSGGNVTANTLTTSATFGNPTATQAGPGDIIVAANGTATFNGPADARRNLTANAANIAVNGTALGSAIALNSGNIMIDPQRAQIGAQGRTSSVTFSNTGNSVTTIGGTGVATGYSLSNAELQRAFAGDIIILAPRVGTGNQQPAGQQVSTVLNDRAPDVVLDTLTLAGANGQSGAMVGNIGSGGRLRIETSGKLRTVGTVTLNNLTSNNRFEILASQAMEIDAANGSISLRDAQQGLGGTLSLTSEDVIAAQLGLIPQIASAASTQAASDLLGVNTGAVNEDGYLRANSIVVNIGNGFFVQNSGAVSTNLRNFADRRGLTVGSGGLSINTATGSTTGSTTAGTARIVVNGRQIAPSGTPSTTGFLTGVDFLRQVQVNGGSQVSGTIPLGVFDPLSTVNGCAILNFAACQINFDNGNIARDIIGDLQRLSPADEDSPDSRGTLRLPFMLIQIRDPEEQAFQPVIDDPVTGSGNDDLWAVDDGRLCPEGETCPPK